MKTWEKIALVSVALFSGAILGERVDNMLRYVHVKGNVIREYGNPENGNYGFELKSEGGRTYFVNFDPLGKSGKEKLIALSEGVRDKFQGEYENDK